MSLLQGAAESGAPVSRLHERQSFELADFPVPTGREEEWRFTPLRRLRRLHEDSELPAGKVGVEVDADPRIAVELAQHGDPRLGAAFVPADRVSARAFKSFSEATVVTVPADTEATRPTVVTVRGEDAAGEIGRASGRERV